jgi:hypothetical protein
MKHEPCCRCLDVHGKHTPAYVDQHGVQYATCLECQKETQLGVYKVRLSPSGSDYNDW